MRFHMRRSCFKILFVLAILFASSGLQPAVAMRPLDGEQWLKKQVPLLESLPKGTVPPSGGSPCTYIPGGSGKCPLNGMNFAGRLVRAPPAIPEAVITVAAASVVNDTKKQDTSS